MAPALVSVEGEDSAPKPKLLRWVHPGELASAASAVVLIAVMFALEWYGLDKPPGKASGAERATAENGWHALAVLRWVTLFVAFLALAAVLLHITQRAHGASSDTAGVLTLLGAGLALALTYRVLIDLPDPSSVVDQKLGAYLGLLSAYGIALGSYHALRERRARTRASEPDGRGATEPDGRGATDPSAGRLPAR